MDKQIPNQPLPASFTDTVEFANFSKKLEEMADVVHKKLVSLGWTKLRDISARDLISSRPFAWLLTPSDYYHSSAQLARYVVEEHGYCGHWELVGTEEEPRHIYPAYTTYIKIIDKPLNPLSMNEAKTLNLCYTISFNQK